MCVTQAYLTLGQMAFYGTVIYSGISIGYMIYKSYSELLHAPGSGQLHQVRTVTDCRLGPHHFTNVVFFRRTVRT